MVIGEESVHTHPKIQSLRSVTKLRSPPAVVITDDSDIFTEINSTLSDTGLSSVEPLYCSSSLMQSNPSIDRCSSISKIHGIFYSGAFNRSSVGSLRSYSQEGFQVLHNQSSSEFQTEVNHVSNNYQAGDIENDDQSSNRRKEFQCFSKKLRRIILGIFVKLMYAGSWAGAAHLLKLTYISTFHLAPGFTQNVTTGFVEEAKINVITSLPTMTPSSFNAPLFTTWFCTMWNILFFPIYLASKALTQPENDTTTKIIFEFVHQFHEKGFTTTQFFGRCSLFCFLSVVTKYMFIYSIGILDTTDVLALFSSKISFIYLLSWVVLHEQFVGLKIVAVILCNTGIALLAYMDGVTKTPTLGGVLLASASAAGSAIYRVFFKKLIGDVTSVQLSIFVTLIGLINFLIMWPFFITLYVMRIETLHWSTLPWIPLGGTAILFLVANLIGSFGIVWTYEVFLTLGIVLAVPASAVIDVYIYGVVFKGMRLAGILLISLGFSFVLLPNNWPDYINLLLIMRRMYQKRSKSRLAESGSLNDHKFRLRNAK